MALVHNNRFVNMPTYSQDLARCMMRVSMAESLYLDYNTNATPMRALAGRHPGDLGSAPYSWLLRGIYPGADDSGFWCRWAYSGALSTGQPYWTSTAISFFNGSSHQVYYDTKTDKNDNPQQSWLYGWNTVGTYLYPCAGFVVMVPFSISGGVARYQYPNIFTPSTNKIECTRWQFDAPFTDGQNVLPVFYSADGTAYYWPGGLSKDLYKMVRYQVGTQQPGPGFRKQDSKTCPTANGLLQNFFPNPEGGFLIRSGTASPLRHYLHKWTYGASTLTPYYSSSKFYLPIAQRHSVWMDYENKISWSGYDFADNEWNFAFPPYPFLNTAPSTITAGHNNLVSVLGVPWRWMPEDGGNFSGHNLYPCKRLNPTPTVWYKYYRTTREEITEALTPETLTGIRLVDRQLLDVRAALESHADTYGRRDNISSIQGNFRQFNPGYIPSQNIYKHAMCGGGYGIAPADVGSYWLRANELIGGNPTYDIDIGEVWNISLLIGPYDYKLKDETI